MHSVQTCDLWSLQKNGAHICVVIKIRFKIIHYRLGSKLGESKSPFSDKFGRIHEMTMHFVGLVAKLIANAVMILTRKKGKSTTKVSY